MNPFVVAFFLAEISTAWTVPRKVSNVTTRVARHIILVHLLLLLKRDSLHRLIFPFVLVVWVLLHHVGTKLALGSFPMSILRSSFLLYIKKRYQVLN